MTTSECWSYAVSIYHTAMAILAILVLVVSTATLIYVRKAVRMSERMAKNGTSLLGRDVRLLIDDYSSVD